MGVLDEIREKNRRLDACFTVLQAVVILLVALFGSLLCGQLTHAAVETNSSESNWAVYDNLVDNFIEHNEHHKDDVVAKGDMMVTHDSGYFGKRGCQAHLMVGDKVKWNFGGTAVLQQNLTVKQYSETFVHEIDAPENLCPSSPSYKGDCRYFDARKWDTAPDKSGRLYSSTLFSVATALMPFWVLMKLVSLDIKIVDKVLNKLFCCVDSTDLFPDLMLDFDICRSYPKMQAVLVGTAKYFRFKIASNTLLWPLTTLGYNSNCPLHLFSTIPDMELYYILSGLALADFLYLMVLFIVCLCCRRVKEYRIIYLPFFVPLFVSIFGVIHLLAMAGFDTIFGVNFSMAFNIEVSWSFGMFSGWFMILSFLEVIGLARQMLSFQIKAVDAAKDAAGEEPALRE